MRGAKVETTVGGDLNIESKQDTNMYKESSTSASIGLSSSGVSGSASNGKMNSDYASVTNQAGIYAGDKGFDVNVKGNTDLKGAVIDSTATPDKNKLTTGTISFSDIKNKAEYSTSGIGASLDSAATKDKHALLGDKGLIPNIPMSSSDNASSTTKSGVAQGTITITNKDKQKQDISKLNRDTNNTLNKLDQIFDKKTVQEKQELAGLFGELAYNKVHEIAKKKGWKDGSAEKNALHAVVGGIMSKLTGSGFISGASGAMINEMVQNELSKIKDPALHQWASAAIGAAVSGTITGNAQAGASSAASGTKNNILSLSEEEEYLKRCKDIIKEYGVIGSAGPLKELEQEFQEKSNARKFILALNLQNNEFRNGLLEAIEINPDIKEYNGVLVSGMGTNTTSSTTREWINQIEREDVLNKFGGSFVYALTQGMIDCSVKSPVFKSVGVGTAIATINDVREDSKIYNGKGLVKVGAYNVSKAAIGTIFFAPKADDKKEVVMIKVGVGAFVSAVLDLNVSDKIKDILGAEK